jgi:hypothetical protein
MADPGAIIMLAAGIAIPLVRSLCRSRPSENAVVDEPWDSDTARKTLSLLTLVAQRLRRARDLEGAEITVRERARYDFHATLDQVVREDGVPSEFVDVVVQTVTRAVQHEVVARRKRYIGAKSEEQKTVAGRSKL